MTDSDRAMTDSPLGLPPYMTGRQVTVDGERYVSLAHVHALFEHTPEGMAFNRVHRRLGRIVSEDRPTLLLDREFGLH
jgi:hypothetical protein